MILEGTVLSCPYLKLLPTQSSRKNRSTPSSLGCKGLRALEPRVGVPRLLHGFLCTMLLLPCYSCRRLPVPKLSVVRHGCRFRELIEAVNFFVCCFLQPQDVLAACCCEGYADGYSYGASPFPVLLLLLLTAGPPPAHP